MSIADDTALSIDSMPTEKLNTEVFEKAEAIAEITSNYLLASEALAFTERGHESKYNQYTIPEPSALSDELKAAHCSRLQKFVEDLAGLVSEDRRSALLEQYSNVLTYLDSSHQVCLAVLAETEYSYPENTPEEQNTIAGRRLYEAIYPDKHYLGIIRLHEDDLAIVLLFEDTLPDLLGEGTMAAGMFDLHPVIMPGGQETNLPFILLSNAKESYYEPDKLLFDASTYFHERLHALNHMLLLKATDSVSREEFLLNDEFLAQFLTDFREQNEVVFQHSMLQSLIHAPCYAHLRDGIANFEEQVREARTALIDLTTFYGLETDSWRTAMYNAITLASQFPMTQWAALAKFKYDKVIHEK